MTSATIAGPTHSLTTDQLAQRWGYRPRTLRQHIAADRSPAPRREVVAVLTGRCPGVRAGDSDGRLEACQDVGALSIVRRNPVSVCVHGDQGTGAAEPVRHVRDGPTRR